MKHLFPPLLPKEALQPPVLALAAHPDDEVIGAGGMLAWHCSVGHPVTVVHLTDGALGDPHHRETDIRAVRRREGRDALAILGVRDVRSHDFPDGSVPEHLDAVAATLRALFAELQPRTVYSFFFTEAHRDHRALAAATALAADALPPDCRCLLYGVNQVVCGGTMFEMGAFVEQKQRALSAFASQLVDNDWRAKIRGRDHAATVNVEDPAVQHAELFADLRPAELADVRELAERLFCRLLRDDA
ncbi:MAG: PIG-L family deacetylase [Planctomycetes bacterium]|nr:PIG-L family deacetylase [Planctomycetota bacterium]